MSYAGLIADADHSQPGREKLFDQIVFFIIERRSAKVRHGGRMHQDFSVSFLNKRALTSFPDSRGDHVHGCLEIEFCPFGGIRSAVLDAGLPVSVGEQFETVGTFRAKPPAGYKGSRVSFNRDQFPVLVVYELAASHGAIRTDGAPDLCGFMARAKVARSSAHCFNTCSVTARQDLPYERPTS